MRNFEPHYEKKCRPRSMDKVEMLPMYIDFENQCSISHIRFPVGLCEVSRFLSGSVISV